MLDTLRTIPTPEGIELTLRVAGPVSRARAWIIDFFIRAIAVIALSMALSALDKFGFGIFLLCWFAIEWGYPVLFEVLWNGATPGKRLAGLRVLHEDGTPVAWRASMARNLLRAIDFLPFFYGFGLLAMLCNRDFKRLGDLAAGTIVVHVDAKRAERGILAAEPRAPDVELTLAEQRAVIDFADRRRRWSNERAAELAAHAVPLMPHAHDPAQRLMRIANFLVGRR